MKLISCIECGVVLDADQIIWPDAYDEQGLALPNATWDGKNYVSHVHCPVCKSPIPEPE